MGRFLPGGGRAFFDMSMTVGFCRYSSCDMAATSFSRRVYQRLVVIPIQEQKETAAYIPLLVIQFTN